MRATGLRAMLGVQWRTHRRGTLVWMFALIATMVGTAGAVAALYTTPEKIHTYAQAVTAGDALVAINGRVEGIDSLGGVIQDEFGFLAAFLLPLLGISLVAQVTRREEEAGRLEAVLGGRVARHVPVLAGLIVASAAIVVTAIAFALGLIVSGVPATRSVLYAASLGALAFVFAGLAALLAQVTLHSRGVYVWSLLVLAVAYLLRGVGDVTQDVGHLALTARLGREGRAVRGDAVVDPAHPPRRRRAARHARRPRSPHAATSAAPSSAGARDRRGRRHGCAARSGWRPPSTARRSSVGSPVPWSSRA